MLSVRINFQASEKLALLFRRISEITGIPLAEILRRAVIVYAERFSSPEIFALLKNYKEGKHGGRKKSL
jgi:hypothetical protein